MTEPLFLTPSAPEPIVKTGMESRLSDNADDWPQEVMQEAFKQHPYLGQYDVSPIMRDVEDERGYGLGYLVVRNKTARLQTPAGQMLAAQAGVRTVKVPVVIKEQKLKEMDVFIDTRGRMMPLSEERMRQALFRPDIFDSYGNPDQSATMIGNQMIPPDRSERMISGRGAVVDQGEVKTSAAKPHLMEAIAPTLLQADIDRVESAMNEDRALARQLITKEATAHFIKLIATVEPVTAADVVKTASELQHHDTVQVARVGDEYRVKVANSQLFDPKVFVMDRIKCASVMGEDVVGLVDQTGAVSMTTDPVVKEDLTTDDEVSEIERFGEYKVRDVEDNEHLGWVFPKVLDFDGLTLPLKVFTNGSVSAIQSDMVGSFVGKGTNIISSNKLEGNGFFYVLTKDGSALAFIPGAIKTTFEDEDGPGIIFETVMAGRVKLRVVPELKKLVKLGDNEYGLPGNVQWCPMKRESITLVDDAGLFTKTASSLSPQGSISIVSDGQLWSFTGHAVEKLAADQRRFLEADDALFIMTAAGVDESVAKLKLAQAGQTGQSFIAGCRPIVPLHETVRDAEAMAKEAVAGMPPKHFLLKEAAGLDDVSTVDKVLSLGFLTPENLATFIEYIPDFEEAISKLAYLLVAVRLGLPDIPEVSVKNAMERLEDTCRALKELVYRKA
jgi:hypothetical protein